MAENSKEKLSFQAEVSKLLDLVANSLYSEREIFLRELISNSADACEKLRYQSLSKKNLLKDEKDLKINIRVSKKKKIIEIEDSGIGMSEEQVAKVFEEFTQAEEGTSAKFGGTGLGLSITKRLAEMMGGEVEAKSELGVGSQFYMRVPRKAPS